MAELTDHQGGQTHRTGRGDDHSHPPAGTAPQHVITSCLRLAGRRIRAVRERLTPESMRARATLAASTVVAFALTVASLAMLALLHNDLRGTAAQGARQQAALLPGSRPTDD